MNYTILGGGLSAISLAYYLQEDPNISEIRILERMTRSAAFAVLMKKTALNMTLARISSFPKIRKFWNL